MKVAIVHDYIKEYGGAERVLESLHNTFPSAPIYTAVFIPEYLGPHKERFEKWNIKTSWADAIPFNSKLISPLRLVAPELFRSLDLSKFDVVIVSATGAYSPNTIQTKSEKHKAVHICYTHTPPRYLYGYETARRWKENPITRFLGTLAIHFLRQVDFNSSKNVDFYIANSEETKARIEKFYRKKAAVIFPPVEFSLNKEIKRGNYFVAGGRIARSKHTDLIIETFVKNGLPLKVFGKGFAGFEDEVRGMIKNHENIEFLGEVGDREKNELLAGAIAFVIASEDEDFGIAPVEAMMAGTPVISHRSGGPIETIIEPSVSSGQGATGVFFDEFSVESLQKALNKFKRTKFDHKYIANYAKKFKKERFEEEIEKFVKKHSK